MHSGGQHLADMGGERAHGWPDPAKGEDGRTESQSALPQFGRAQGCAGDWSSSSGCLQVCFAGAGPTPEGADPLEGKKIEVWGCFLGISPLKSKIEISAPLGAASSLLHTQSQHPSPPDLWGWARATGHVPVCWGEGLTPPTCLTQIPGDPGGKIPHCTHHFRQQRPSREGPATHLPPALKCPSPAGQAQEECSVFKPPRDTPKPPAPSKGRSCAAG